MRINSAGNVAIGTNVASADRNLFVNKNITGSVNAGGVHSIGTVQSDVTASARNFRSAIGTAAATFTLTDLVHFHAEQSAFGVGSTVTNQIGFNATNNLIGATNNYGFLGNIPAGTGRWNFYAAGTANNLFAGNVQLGNSGTATNNFTFAPATNGTFKLARGNAGATTQDIMTVDAAGTVSFPQGVQGVPSGAIMDFAMNAAPTGWLACDGAAISRTTYAALFAAIGTTWGAGDGSTTFNLPDMRGYFRRGVGTNSDGTAAGAFAAKVIDATRYDGNVLVGSRATSGHNSGLAAGGAYNVVGLVSDSTPSIQNTESRPKNIAVLTCIKT
jgi:hypothetical protein